MIPPIAPPPTTSTLASIMPACPCALGSPARHGLKRCAAVKITAVHTAVVEANYDWTFVRIDTDSDGLSGLGECFPAPGLTGIVRDLAPLLVGEDPARRRPAVEQAALGRVGGRLLRGHRLQRDLGHRGRAVGPRGARLRRAHPPPARRPLPRLGAHVRRLPRRRRAGVDGRHDGRAPRALGPGAARGAGGGRDPRARARPRLRARGARRAVHAGDVRAARPRGRGRARLQRAEVRPRRPHGLHAGHRLGHAQPGRGAARWSSSPPP